MLIMNTTPFGTCDAHWFVLNSPHTQTHTHHTSANAYMAQSQTIEQLLIGFVENEKQRERTKCRIQRILVERFNASNRFDRRHKVYERV